MKKFVYQHQYNTITIYIKSLIPYYFGKNTAEQCPKSALLFFLLSRSLVKTMVHPTSAYLER